MENTIQHPYQDSPDSSRSISPPVPGSRSFLTKPLPSIPNSPPPTFEEAYRDDPSQDASTEPITAPQSRHYRVNSFDILNHQEQVHFALYTDAVPENDDDVPLAHLIHYPTEAPPAYHVVVRQSYRDTLVAHIPHNFTGYPELDEEAGLERPQPDDIRFTVERLVAGLIVAMVLLMITTVFVWQILSFTLSF